MKQASLDKVMSRDVVTMQGNRKQLIGHMCWRVCLYEEWLLGMCGRIR